MVQASTNVRCAANTAGSVEAGRLRGESGEVGMGGRWGSGGGRWGREGGGVGREVG